LTGTEEPATGPSASTELIAEVLVQHAATSVADKVRAHGAAYDDASERVEDVKQQDTQDDDIEDAVLSRERYPPPQYPYPASEASSSTRPPPFSSLFAPPPNAAVERSGKRFSVPAPFAAAVEGEASSAPAYTAHQPEFQPEPWDPDQAAARAFHDPVAETKRALPQDTKGESSRRDEDAEPPPAYTEGDSPLQSFSFAMAAAGGASSIITQVQQGGPTVNAIGGE
jgi:G patch domain-containing protein 1